jgi:hypothetical protein
VQASGEFRESSVSGHCIHRQQQETDSMRIVRIEGVPPTGDVVTDIGVEQRVEHTLSGVVFEMTSKEQTAIEGLQAALTYYDGLYRIRARS